MDLEVINVTDKNFDIGNKVKINSANIFPTLRSDLNNNGKIEYIIEQQSKYLY